MRGTLGAAPECIRADRHPVCVSLTDRQRDVLSALAAGLTYKETGDRLGFSHSTIRHEAMRIYALLGARDRDDAVELARKRGLLAREH